MLNFDRLKLAIPLNLCSNIKEELFENIIDGNLSVSNEILNELNGVNLIQLNYRDNLLIFDITGEFNARKNYLGLINKDNIRNVLEKFNNLGFVNFEVEEVIAQTKVFLCDITQDIFVSSDIEKVLCDLKQRLQVNSDRYYIHKYSCSGISIKPIAQSRKETFDIYPKYKQLRLKKHERYRQCVGYEYFEKIKNMLRVELQLKSYSLIRHYFNLEKNKEIMLKDLLMSSENPLIMKLAELGICEDYMNAEVI